MRGFDDDDDFVGGFRSGGKDVGLLIIFGKIEFCVFLWLMMIVCMGWYF